MRFMHPLLLSWGLLVLVPVLLHLFRPRPRKARVSTLPFFKSLAREYQDSAWLRRLKRLLSLLLAVLIILAATAALVRVVVAPSAEGLRNVVIVVDRSASMAARDERGKTRLEAALALVRDRLAGLPGGVPVSVMAYDRRPEMLSSRSRERREAERALARIRVRPIEGDAEAALSLATRLAALETPASVWHATDGLLRGDQETPPGVTVEHLGAALESPVNAGITAFQLRRLPLEHSRFEAFVQIHCTAREVLEAELEIRLDGELAGIRRMSLDSGGRERFILPVNAGDGRTLSLKLTAPGDVLALDDEAYARIPELPPLNVVWVSPSPDSFTELALASLGRDGDVEIYHCEPSDWPPAARVDVAIFDGWLPEELPADASVVAIDPPRSLGPVEVVRISGGGLPLEALRATGEAHPLLYGVATARIALTQTAVLGTEGPLEPVWTGPSGPVLVAGEVRGRKLVVMGFAPERCERLPLMASYPLLIGNAVYWSARTNGGASSGGGGPRRADGNHKSGDLVRLEGKVITWSLPGDGAPKEAPVPPGGRWMELDRVGLWRTDAGEAGSASLLSRRETEVNAASADARAPRPPRPEKPARVGAIVRGDLTRLMLWAVLCLLALDCWLYHRHGVR